ncbi:MAG TPA: HDOD domain-containing protein [Opitutaceae bacterium]|nr:HDOD domain-containing protein [Opitutaceae bacterium]
MPAVSTPFSREKLLQIARSLPADLHVLSTLGEMLQDVNSELDEIATLLRRDVALAARIVRISNSAMFGGGGQVASIEEAVNRVGFSEILKLVGTATAARFTERALEHYDISAVKLRDNMLHVAFACEALAHCGGFDARVAYTAGLLRPLGLMVLDRAGRGHLHWTERFSASKCPNYSFWEGNLFGVDNCEVAALILDEWRFPRELSTALRSQYLARPGDGENRLACLLNVANGLAHQVSRAFAGELTFWEIGPEKLQGAGITADDLAPAAAAADAAFDAAVAALAM